MTRPLASCLALPLLALFLLLSGGCGGPAPAGEFVRQAERMHRQALGGAVPLDPDLGEYLQHVGQRLMNGARAAAPGRTAAPIWSRFQTHLVNCDTVNAYWTGGTHVYAYAGLLRLCETEEELAAALAHALAHAIRLDVEQAGVRPREDRSLRLVVWDYVIHRFTLEQERQAHELAFRIYVQAGWSPARYGNLFERLSDGYGQMSAAPDRLSPAARARSAQAMAASAQGRSPRPNVADPMTFQQLRRKAAALRESSPHQSEAVLYLRAFPNCILPGDTPEQQAAQDLLRPPAPPRVELEPN